MQPPNKKGLPGAVAARYLAADSRDTQHLAREDDVGIGNVIRRSDGLHRGPVLEREAVQVFAELHGVRLATAARRRWSGASSARRYPQDLARVDCVRRRNVVRRRNRI